jgi:hypothetical protein
MNYTTTCHGSLCPKREDCKHYIGNRPPGSRSMIGDCVPYDLPIGTAGFPLFEPMPKPAKEPSHDS